MKTFYKSIVVTKAFVAIALFYSNAFAQVWTDKADIPGAGRWGAYCFSLAGKIYAGGGYIGGGASKRDLWQYDPATNQWTIKAPVPGSTSRTQAIAFTLGDKAYVGLGSQDYNTFGSMFLNDLWEYDAANDAWTQKASLPDSGRHGSAVFVVNGKAYAVGGYTDYPSAAKTNDTWEYDPVTDQWTARQPYPLPYVYDAQAFAIGNNGYVTGGRTAIPGYASDRTSKATYCYDASDDVWIQRADFWWNGRENGVAFSLNGKGYVGLGQSLDSMSYYYVEFEEYDEAANTWTNVTSLPTVDGDRGYPVAATLNGKAYVGAGFAYLNGEIYYNDWFQFDPLQLSTSSPSLKGSDVRCFPNPASGLVRIELESTGTHQGMVKFYDALGRNVLQTRLPLNGIVDISSLPAGVFIVEVSVDSMLQRVRLVHQTK